jgi:hypothetical protein
MCPESGELVPGSEQLNAGSEDQWKTVNVVMNEGEGRRASGPH